MARGFGSAPASNAHVIEAEQDELAKDRMLDLGTSKSTWVRATIAARHDCPFGLMVTLAHDYSADVRTAVAGNPFAQRSVLQYLAADKSLPVVRAVLENPALPEDVLEELAFHKKADIRAAATARLDTGLPGARDSHSEDEHTPELAEHVSAWGTGPEFEFASMAWADAIIATHAMATPVTEDDEAEPEVPTDDAMAPVPDHRVASFFSHTPGQGMPLATRTAPVRGFRPPSE